MRELKFRSWHPDDEDLKMRYWDINNIPLFRTETVMQFTGFKDSEGKDIFEGDIISDFAETDEGIKQSLMKVFWNEPTGSWHLDNSFNQDETCSTELWLELQDFKYKVVANIYEIKKNNL